MAVFVNFLVNLWRFTRNVYARLLKRPPDYIVFDVGGDLPEFERRAGFVRRRLSPGPPAPSLEGLRRRLERISGDGRVRGVVLRIQGLNAGWASLEELRMEISAFRERGGRVVAYLVEADTGSYYLASATDEVLATPLATVDVVDRKSVV